MYILTLLLHSLLPFLLTWIQTLIPFNIFWTCHMQGWFIYWKLFSPLQMVHNGDYSERQNFLQSIHSIINIRVNPRVVCIDTEHFKATNLWSANSVATHCAIIPFSLYLNVGDFTHVFLISLKCMQYIFLLLVGLWTFLCYNAR